MHVLNEMARARAPARCAKWLDRTSITASGLLSELKSRKEGSSRKCSPFPSPPPLSLLLFALFFFFCTKTYKRDDRLARRCLLQLGEKTSPGHDPHAFASVCTRGICSLTTCRQVQTVHPAPLPRRARPYQSALLFSPGLLLLLLLLLLRNDSRFTTTS